MTPNPFHLDEVFFEPCLAIPGKAELQSPISSTTHTSGLNGGDGNTLVSDSSQLTDHYPAAYKDFYGKPSGAPCIYKSGPAWPKGEGLSLIREGRPVYGHPIAPSWLKIGSEMCEFLNSRSIMWTSIDPIAFANAGEKSPFCPLLMQIGVKPESLLYDATVAAAKAIKGILSLAGFPDIEVAFRESEVTRSMASPKLVSSNPLTNNIYDFRKPFTPTLGLSIAPLKTPHFEGTGALYLRLNKDNDRIVLLTAAHVIHPPPKHTNEGMSRKGTGQPHEYIVALGNWGCHEPGIFAFLFSPLSPHEDMKTCQDHSRRHRTQ